jgi:hypothetical protein
MFIHKLSITTCSTGYLVEDETDPEQFIPLGGFGAGQLLNALSFARDLIERDAADRAAEQAMFEAKARGENVVPGPGWKPPAAEPPPAPSTITRPIKTDREIVDEVNDLARVLLGKQGATGYQAPGIHRFYGEGQSPRVARAWEDAVEIYELITGSEVSDALQAILEEEEAAAVPAVPVEPAL